MIKVLDKKIADKIAAGEVIDRPVSIIKELVENSIDAGASSITIEIKEGGKSYIRVTDNGRGIAPEEVEIAFKRHATSKISDENDLKAIGTLGFRGEALASICAVARVELVTKRKNDRLGRKVVVEGSTILENTATGCPEGTTITVKDLFFNLPARHKFMASDSSEARRIIDFASRIALSYPDIRFSVINGTGRAFTTAGKGSILNSILSIYGTDLGDNLIPVEGSRNGFTMKGFVSDTGTSLSNRSRQIFCVNGRVVSSAVIERAIDKAYSRRMFTGRFPIAFLFIALPADKLDVNIHPTKKEIRFDDNAQIEDFVSDCIGQALQTKEAIPHVSFNQPVNYKYDSGRQLKISDVTGTKPQNEADILPKEKVQAEKEEVDINNLLTTLRKEEEEKGNGEEEKIFIAKPSSVPFDFDELSIVGTVLNMYIAVQDENNLFLIDQHAAHERIFFEKFLQQFYSGEKMLQPLIVPLKFSVPAEVGALQDLWIEKIRDMGFEIELFGPNLYIVRSIPAFMDISEAEGFLDSVFKEFDGNDNFDNRKALERLITRSCKAAVKAGDVLKPSEIKSLLEQLKKCDNPFSCPHGRPTFIKFTGYELEKMFKRV